MARVPKTVSLPPEKMRVLSLTPVDGFILSRIDGSVTEPEIATLTGLDPDSVRSSLDKLVSLGAITFGDPPAQAKPESRPSKLPDVAVSEDSDVGPQGARKIPRGLYDPAELDEDVEIEMDHRRAILDRYYILGETSLYELLGVERSADKKTIKRGYFEAAALFHPDRYFRKRLGTFKPKMEAIFARVTLAHDTLTDPDARAEYDGYLISLESTKKLEAQLELQTVEPAIPREEPKTPPPQPSPVPSVPPGDDKARRDALALRLKAFRRPSGTSTIPSAPPSAPDVLRRYHDNRATAARERRAREHAKNGHEAAARGDWVAATTAFRLALTVSPNDADLKREHAEAQAKASAILGEQYRKQATYEEKSGDWPAAAKTWARCAKTLEKDAHAQERAAHAILRCNGTAGSLHDARTFAQKAVELEPKKPAYRATLAEVYLAAGLPLNTRREVEAALQLAPDGPDRAALQALLKKVAKAK